MYCLMWKSLTFSFVISSLGLSLVWDTTLSNMLQLLRMD